MFVKRSLSQSKTIMAALLLAAVWMASTATPVQAQHPSWLNSSVVYCVYPEIFSSTGFQGVTKQLNRLKELGVNVIWLLPVTPVGQPYNGHPAFDSPYAVHDYYAVNPSYGSTADLTSLIQTAHGLGMKVILDEVLNHTSWDNALTTQHPEYYRHSDGNAYNVGSEEQAFNFSDVVQLDYSNQSYGLWTYMDNMLNYWITTYGIDGFRFDTADDPAGPNRNIPQAFWQQLRTSLEATKSDILMLGEEEDAALALAPFELDYGWNLQSALKQAATSGNSASGLQTTWQNQVTGWPAGMLHLSLTQDWDLPGDLQEYGGTANTLDAALFNFTINGIPLLFNGEEVGNDKSGNNTHTLIDWNSPNASSFTNFYTQLIALRNANSALQQGTMTWEPNSASSQVVTYDRMSGATEFLIEINFSGSSVNGTVSVPQGNAWTDVTPSGSPGGKSHRAPGTLSLLPYDFAVFERSTAATAPSVPMNLTAAASSGQVQLSWTAATGANSYNVYRGTSAGGESGTPIATGVTSTSYTNTGLTNGTTYYYKISAMNGGGASAQSNEAYATPQAIAPTVPSGLRATAGNTQITLNWTASTGATSYNLYRSATSGGEGNIAIVSGITATSYTNTGLTNGVTYYYKVAAVNSSGTSALSGEASAKPAVTTYTGQPYTGAPAAIPGTVQFDNFDKGGEGVAYHDTDAANNGGKYRTSEGVDIETSTDNGAGNGYDVGWLQPGEWMKYTVNVGSSAAYAVGFRVASGIASGTAGTFHLEDETGANRTGEITVSSTGGWQSWATLSGAATLTAGNHILRVVIDSGNAAFNLEYMTFSMAPSYAGTPYTGTPIALPGTIQAENFDTGGEGVAYHDTDTANDGGQYRPSEAVDIENCTDTGGGYDVGWTHPGEWMKYTVNVQSSKSYTVVARVASGISGGTAGTFHVEDESGNNLTGAITVSSTGGWQTWTTVQSTATLTFGKHVLRVVFDTGNAAFNLNYLAVN